MNDTSNAGPPFDLQVAVYRSLRGVVVIALAAVAIKMLLFETVLLKTEQMEPVLMHGDRALVFRAPFAPVLGWIFRPKRNAPVVFDYPPASREKPGRGCLRIAALPGDRVEIEEGRYSLHSPEGSTTARTMPEESVLPPDYSPRDNLTPLQIPQPGEVIDMDTVFQRDLFFYASMIAQENPGKECRIGAELRIDDSLSNDYIIPDFPLYSGTFKAVPDSLRMDWFFWDRLGAYLGRMLPDRQITLHFTVLLEGAPVTEYEVGQRFAFLLADVWTEGYDSRYFGPVALSQIRGTVIAVLWSFAVDSEGGSEFRGKRIGRIVR